MIPNTDAEVAIADNTAVVSPIVVNWAKPALKKLAGFPRPEAGLQNTALWYAEHLRDDGLNRNDNPLSFLVNQLRTSTFALFIIAEAKETPSHNIKILVGGKHAQDLVNALKGFKFQATLKYLEIP